MQQDRIESGEPRWQTIGMVDRLLVLVLVLVAPTVREHDDGAEVQRIISARKDVPKEGNRYEQDRQVRGRPGRTCHR